ncbi:MAG: hypothetical protein ACI8XG_000111 [Congregibacter sp.]
MDHILWGIAVLKKLNGKGRGVLLLLLSSILFGCQSVPSIHRLLDQTAQFDRYKTFGFHPTLLLQLLFTITTAKVMVFGEITQFLKREEPNLLKAPSTSN